MDDREVRLIDDDQIERRCWRMSARIATDVSAKARSMGSLSDAYVQSSELADDSGLPCDGDHTMHWCRRRRSRPRASYKPCRTVVAITAPVGPRESTVTCDRIGQRSFCPNLPVRPAWRVGFVPVDLRRGRPPYLSPEGQSPPAAVAHLSFLTAGQYGRCCLENPLAGWKGRELGPTPLRRTM